MADRPLVLDWPLTVDATSGPTAGTRLNKDYFDSILAAIRDAIYDPDEDDGPPETTAEVVGARGGYTSLDERLDALLALATAGASTAKTAATTNWIWNDGLFWSSGDSAAPDGWDLGAGLTIARISAQPTPASGPPTCKIGRNLIAVTNPDGTERDFSFDVVSDTMTATYGNAALGGAKWAGGVWVYTAVSGMVDVYIEDASGSKTKVGEQGSTTSEWKWTADGATYDGGKTLIAGATRLKLIIKLKSAGTAYLCGPMLGPGEKAPFSIPAPIRHGQFVHSDDALAAPSAALRCVWNTYRPVFIVSGRVIVTTPGTAAGVTAGFLKDLGSPVDVFGGALTIGADPDSDSGYVLPASAALASCNATGLAFTVSVVDADVRGISIAVDYLEPIIYSDAWFGGGQVI